MFGMTHVGEVISNAHFFIACHLVKFESGNYKLIVLVHFEEKMTTGRLTPM